MEAALAHTQHDLDQLNEALLAQKAQIDELRRQVEKLQSLVETLPEQPQDVEAERPPHY